MAAQHCVPICDAGRSSEPLPCVPQRLVDCSAAQAALALTVALMLGRRLIRILSPHLLRAVPGCRLVLN